MPAHRSQDEKVIRDEVVRKFRAMLPGCRIIHEINACGFGNRIDVLAVGEAEILACEIKSKRDKMDRMQKQCTAMLGLTSRVFAAIHEKHLVEQRFGPGRKQCTRNTPNDIPSQVVPWIYPRQDRSDCRNPMLGEIWFDRPNFIKPRVGLPIGAIHVLHREELVAIAKTLQPRGVHKLDMPQLGALIRHEMPGKRIDRAICAALRARRRCAEADDPIDPIGLEAAQQSAML